MARARRVPGLLCETPFGEAAARTIRVRTEEVLSHSAGVLDTADIERVHDMRVATRRLRAALELYEPCFPKRPFRAVLADVKALAAALGARRDPDVALELLAGHGGAAPDRPGIESFARTLRERQADGNEVLGSALAEARSRALSERLLALAAEAAAP